MKHSIRHGIAVLKRKIEEYSDALFIVTDMNMNKKNFLKAKLAEAELKLSELTIKAQKREPVLVKPAEYNDNDWRCWM